MVTVFCRGILGGVVLFGFGLMVLTVGVMVLSFGVSRTKVLPIWGKRPLVVGWARVERQVDH